MSDAEEMTRKLATERERADYARRNTRIIEAARVEEMRKRDAAEQDARRYRWLRNNPAWVGYDSDYRPDQIDMAIDHAMTQTPNAKSQATDAALSRQVACTDGLGVAPPAPTVEQGNDE